VEGVTVGLAYGLKRFQDLGLAPTEIRLTGGGSKSKTWRQIVADSFGVPVVCLATAEGASLGAAVQAAYVSLKEAGKGMPISELAEQLVRVDPASRAEPETEAAAFYQGQRERQMSLTKSLKDNGWL
jgi:xylulokinase